MTNFEDPVRRWSREIAQLRTRAVRAGLERHTPQCEALSEVLSDTLDTCVNLVQELAGARLECESIAGRLVQEKSEWEHLFAHLPVAVICTDGEGTILYANRSAAALLNVSARRLPTRLLAHFIDDRSRFSEVLRTVPLHDSVETTIEFTVRPRERAPLNVTAQVMRRTPLEPTQLLWFFSPTSREAASAASVSLAILK